jgi:hypothetical protein
VTIAQAIKDKTGSKMKDFKAVLAHGPSDFPELVKLADDVEKFASSFPCIGYEN